jgi:hypothetical protein
VCTHEIKPLDLSNINMLAFLSPYGGLGGYGTSAYRIFI